MILQFENEGAVVFLAGSGTGTGTDEDDDGVQDHSRMIFHRVTQFSHFQIDFEFFFVVVAFLSSPPHPPNSS